MRDQIETIKDKILLLYLMHSAKKYKEIEGNLKLQKLVFLTEWKLMDSDIKAFHFKFFRYRIGPFSKELLCDYNDLKEHAYVNSVFELKSKATNLLDYIIEPIAGFKNNSRIFDKIEETCMAYSKYTGPSLTNKVYEMEIIPYDLPSDKIKIRDIPAFLDILVPELFKAEINFEIPRFLLEDIRQEFMRKDLTQEEERIIIEESKSRLIKLILSKSEITN